MCLLKWNSKVELPVVFICHFTSCMNTHNDYSNNTLFMCLLISAFPKTCFLMSLSPFIYTIRVTLGNSLKTCPFLRVRSNMCTCMLNCFNCLWLSVTPWTVARQAPLSMGFSRQEYWNGFPCPPPGDLPDLGIEPVSLTSPALGGGLFTTSAT